MINQNKMAEEAVASTNLDLKNSIKMNLIAGSLVYFLGGGALYAFCGRYGLPSWTWCAGIAMGAGCPLVCLIVWLCSFKWSGVLLLSPLAILSCFGFLYLFYFFNIFFMWSVPAPNVYKKIYVVFMLFYGAILFFVSLKRYYFLTKNDSDFFEFSADFYGKKIMVAKLKSFKNKKDHPSNWLKNYKIKVFISYIIFSPWIVYRFQHEVNFRDYYFAIAFMLPSAGYLFSIVFIRGLAFSLVKHLWYPLWVYKRTGLVVYEAIDDGNEE